MIVKVCGLRDADNIRAVGETGVDWLGFDFRTESPRYVSQIRSRAGIIPDYSSLERMPGCCPEAASGVGAMNCKRVGVFADDMPQTIVTRVVNYNLDIVQLNGSESEVMIDNLRRTLDPDIHAGIRIMKRIAVESIDDIGKYKQYAGHADYLLFDVCRRQTCDGRTAIDVSLLDAYDGEVPFLLGGGISVDDLETILGIDHKMFLGIDLNSCFETETAVKDAVLIKDFISQL